MIGALLHSHGRPQGRRTRYNRPGRRRLGFTLVELPAVSRRGRAAFTLVELLVVIGIIGALIGILMPALNSARKKAQAVQCATNLRTLAQGWQMYANANKGLACPARLPRFNAQGAMLDGVYGMDNGQQYRPRWYELLGAQTGVFACRNPQSIEDDSWTIENPLFLCPTVSDWNNSRNYPYGYNYQFLGNARPKTGGTGWINWPVKAARIKASQTVMALDCIGTAAGLPKDQRMAYYADGNHDPAGQGNKGHLVDPPRLTGNSDYADPERRSPECRSGPDPRHSNKANVAFCDGHVELMDISELGYVVRADGSIATDGPGTHNSYFSGMGMDLDPPSIN